jgi:hypothetical protein
VPKHKPLLKVPLVIAALVLTLIITGYSFLSAGSKAYAAEYRAFSGAQGFRIVEPITFQDAQSKEHLNGVDYPQSTQAAQGAIAGNLTTLTFQMTNGNLVVSNIDEGASGIGPVNCQVQKNSDGSYIISFSYDQQTNAGGEESAQFQGTLNGNQFTSASYQYSSAWTLTEDTGYTHSQSAYESADFSANIQSF